MALRRVDAVTAIMLAASPVDILPSGITHAGPLAEAIATGVAQYDVAAKIELREGRGPGGIMAILPWKTPQFSGAVVLVRRDGTPFSMQFHTYK